MSQTINTKQTEAKSENRQREAKEVDVHVMRMPENDVISSAMEKVHNSPVQKRLIVLLEGTLENISDTSRRGTINEVINILRRHESSLAVFKR